VSKDHSFDIVSQVDLQEVTNAVEQSRKEVATRFDFKGSHSAVEWNLQDKKITLKTENELRLKSLRDILDIKFAKRHVSLKCIDAGELEKATGGTVRQVLTIKQGIEAEKAKSIVKAIKASKLKVQTQIQDDQIRVQAAKIDDLQAVIQQLKTEDFGLDLQFINYR
jgi:cyclic-di-GMP-binding protein